MQYILTEEEMKALVSREIHRAMLGALDHKTWCLECLHNAVRECPLEVREKIYGHYQMLQNENHSTPAPEAAQS